MCYQPHFFCKHSQNQPKTTNLEPMKFGKLDDLTGVDFTMPPDPPRTQRILAKALNDNPKKLKVYLGATGWSNKEWVGKWYPAKTKAGDFLDHYSLIFNTIEFNTTHYRVPKADLIERWYERAASDFKFCPKIPQQISHRARLKAEEPTLRFAESVAGLREKLGPCFIQLPDRHSPEGAMQVTDFLETWPSETELHWECRHPDWFQDMGGNSEMVFDALESKGHGTVITDVAGRRDAMHMQLTTPSLMLRFVGNGLHPTDYQRSDDWINRIAEWSEKGLKSAWIFIHQPEITQVPDFTAYWAKELNEKCGLQLTLPKPIKLDIQGTLF